MKILLRLATGISASVLIWVDYGFCAAAAFWAVFAVLDDIAYALERQ